MINYVWDPNKAAINQQKHGISFADAVSVFNDDFALTVRDMNTKEERFISIGMDAFGQILVVVYTWRGEATIRIISARKATRREWIQYEG